MDWGLGIGDWGLGIGPNPQSPIPNPQSPFPVNTHIYYYLGDYWIFSMLLFQIIFLISIVNSK